ARGRKRFARIVVVLELCRICQIEDRVLRKSNQRFRGGRQRAAQNRFMNEIYAEARRVAPRHVRDVIAHLIFLLIPQYWKVGDAGDELVVPIRFKSSDGARRGGKGKRQ